MRTRREMQECLDQVRAKLEVQLKNIEPGQNRIVRRTVRRVYPNDPCPCGSGKKYKMCHGNLP